MKHLALSVTVLAISVPASAGLINYGDFAGDNVNFRSVSESSLEPGAFYGAPQVIGDTLDFTTDASFAVAAENGGNDFLDVRLTFTVEAADGLLIDSITVEEFGAYFNVGPESTATVSGIGFAEPLGGSLVTEEFIFTQDGDGSGRWQDGFTLHFTPSSSVMFTLDNLLFTSAANPGVGFIDKKGLDVSVHTIPTPPVIALLAVGGLVARRQRRP